MDFAHLSRPPRLRQKRDRFWLTVGLCALTAALILGISTASRSAFTTI